MSILFAESVSEKRERVIRELSEGQESATKLKSLLQKPIGSDGSLSAEEALLAKVLRSFTETLSVLDSSEGEVAQILVSAGENGSQVAASSNDLRSEGSCESGKRSSPVIKDRRGSYKRRSSSNFCIL